MSKGKNDCVDPYFYSLNGLLWLSRTNTQPHAKRTQNNIFSSNSSKKFQENNEIMTSTRNHVNIWWLSFCYIYLGKCRLNGCAAAATVDAGLLALFIILFCICLAMLVFFFSVRICQSFLLQFRVPVIFCFSFCFRLKCCLHFFFRSSQVFLTLPSQYLI